VLWVKPSVKYLHKFLGQEEIKTVITTGPPHSMHLIGLGLKKRLNIKWIADFRDPWTEIHYHNKLPLTKKSKRKHKELEKKVLENSDSILTTSLTTKNNFKVKTSTPVDFLPNGFTDFQKKNFALDKKFTLSYIGRLYDGNYLLVILQALSELTEENKDFKSHFQFNYVGDNESIIQRLFKKFHLGKFLNCTGQVSHSQSIDHQRSSQVLLLLLSEDFTSEIIPGKLFEYLNAKRPIIAIGPKNWDVKEILDETQGGSCFNYKDKEGLKKQIKTHFEAYQNQDLHAHSKNLEQYHRRELTGKLAGLI
jgi:glycosyltransferase involved in cell wall biosynthesis